MTNLPCLSHLLFLISPFPLWPTYSCNQTLITVCSVLPTLSSFDTLLRACELASGYTMESHDFCFARIYFMHHSFFFSSRPCLVDKWKVIWGHDFSVCAMLYDTKLRSTSWNIFWKWFCCIFSLLFHTIWFLRLNSFKVFIKFTLCTMNHILLFHFV